jgi:hypothetical protein
VVLKPHPLVGVRRVLAGRRRRHQQGATLALTLLALSLSLALCLSGYLSVCLCPLDESRELLRTKNARRAALLAGKQAGHGRLLRREGRTWKAEVVEMTPMRTTFSWSRQQVGDMMACSVGSSTCCRGA